jgi:hypothetical protein
LDDEEADMCIAEWSWGSKSKPFVCSSLKTASKSWQDEMRYMFDVAKCDRIFDYLLLEKQIKLPSGHVIPYIKNGFSLSGIVKTGAIVILFFNSSKLTSRLGVHSKVLPFTNSSVIGLEILENPSMNLL